MNIFLNEYFGFCFELNFELNHFKAKFNEKINFQNVSPRASTSSIGKSCTINFLALSSPDWCFMWLKAKLIGVCRQSLFVKSQAHVGFT